MADGSDEAAVQQAVAEVTAVIDDFPVLYDAALLRGQRAKLGLLPGGDDAADTALAADWLQLAQQHRVDFTLAWRRLCDAAAGDVNPLLALFTEAAAAKPWLARWQQRCQTDGAAAAADRAERMRRVNPWVIPRNHHVEQALAAASEHENLEPFEALLAALRRPYEESAGNAAYAEPAPLELTAGYQTFCGT
jgi:uncharacterized protein YdiU (UPF0061 family)